MGLFDGGERKELEQKMKREGRLPPGQSLTLKWPVLHYGSVPRFDAERWDFRVYGTVEVPIRCEHRIGGTVRLGTYFTVLREIGTIQWNRLRGVYPRR